MEEGKKKKQAMQFILLFGVVSALGDITYEGARSVYGPYLGALGASAVAIGVISGFGEFLGYFLRLVSGYFADRTGKYWPITILGYGMLIAVPLLALAGNWPMAALFIILERVGKAIRSPAKDALLSYATKQVGTGFGFGIHEAMDQVGAFIGPLIFTTVLAVHSSYQKGFSLMWIPAILTVLAVLFARAKVPNPAAMEESTDKTTKQVISSNKLNQVFWIYALFTFVSVLGFANFQIISYHLATKHVVNAAWIPTLYAVAMGVDALVALFIGKTYDRVGFSTLALIPLLTVFIPFLGFSQIPVLIVLAVILWGSVMGIHETIMRAAIADLTSQGKRGSAYGVFNTIYGVAWFLGSVVIGFLYDYSIYGIFAFVVIVELMAIITFIYFKGACKRLLVNKSSE